MTQPVSPTVVREHLRTVVLHLSSEGTIVAFGRTAAASIIGLPTLSDISTFAEQHGLRVEHLGFGCFDMCRDGAKGLEFFGGGAMLVGGDEPSEQHHYTPLRGDDRWVAAWTAWARSSFPIVDRLARTLDEGIEAEVERVVTRESREPELVDGRW